MSRFPLVAAAAALALAACSSGSPTGSGTDPGAPPVATVSVTLNASALQSGATTSATATLQDASGNPLTGRSITWSSSNSSVASITTGGSITALAVGTATITATSEGKSGNAQLMVSAGPVAVVSVSLSASSVVLGVTAQATAAVTDAHGNPIASPAVTWASSNTATATISAGGVITPVGAGNTTISANVSGIVGSAALAVTLPPVATVTVTLGSPQLAPAGTTQASAVTSDAGGHALSGRVIAWSSGNTAVATVNTAGLVTAVAPGSTSIIATSEGKSGSAPLTVTLQPVTSVTLTGTARIKVGDGYSYTVTERLGDGTIVQRPVTWSIAVAGTATVTQSGLVTPIASGPIGVVTTIDGAPWTTTLTAYDWVALNTGTIAGVSLAADLPVTNFLGVSEYPSLLVVCANSGTFAVGVGFTGIITGNGLVTYSGDNGIILSETWLESSPNFNTLTYPGLTNLLQKGFATTLATNHLFTFAFSEFGNGSHATAWRLTGMSAAIAPLLAACPGNSLMAQGAPAPEDAATILGRLVKGSTDANRRAARAAAAPSTAIPALGGQSLRAPEVMQMKRGG